MAGRGSRFAEVGYEYPKPLIDVEGEPMIKKVVDNFKIYEDCRFIFLVLKEQYDKYLLKYLLPLICEENACEIVVVDQVTQGAACTVLLAKDLINNDEELIIANSDQIIEWEANHFLRYMRKKKSDAGIVTFLASGSKWSFVKVNEDGGITEVAEKNPISNIGTTGHYYTSKGSLFVQAAEQMISKNIRTNNEFYVAPSFNELIGDGYKVINYPIPEMIGLGTPEDLEKYLSRNK